MAKRSDITSQTKQNFMDAFWDLYCDKRIEKITVKDITVKAGYNRSTFYEYFRDPYDVLDQLEATLIPNIHMLPPVRGSQGMPMDMVMGIYEQYSKYYSVLLGERGDPAFASKLKNVIKPILMAAFADKSQEKKVELDYILEYTLTAMIGIMSYWFSKADPLPKERLYALMHRLMEEGVFTQIE